MTDWPTIEAWLVSGYGLVLLGVAWGLDRLGERSATRSASWRTSNFVYHSDHDAWKCHEDEWLWPASFDPEKRVIRYVGQHAVCGRCPVKDSCSPTPGPREITRAVDPWPHSEAGRFHRGIGLAVAAIGAFLPLIMMFGDRRPLDFVVLGTAAAIIVALGWPLAVHLWRTPSNAPEILPHDARLIVPDAPAAPLPVEQLVDRYASRWTSDRRRV